MTITITKSCSVRLNGDVRPLKAGELITLPPEKAQRLISAGYAKTVKPSDDEYRLLCQEISESDPKGDCWNWIQANRPELWQGHIAAFRSGDLHQAHATFKQMIEEWNKKINEKEKHHGNG